MINYIFHDSIRNITIHTSSDDLKDKLLKAGANMLAKASGWDLYICKYGEDCCENMTGREWLKDYGI